MGNPPVVIDVIRQVAFLLDVRNLVRHDVIERVVASLQLSLESQTRLLKQVDNHVSTRELTTSIEPDTDEFTKTRRVVIPHGLSITPGLKYRVGLDNFVLKTRLTFLLLASSANASKVGDNLLGVLSLASTRLTSNENRLVLANIHHTLVGALSNTEDMGWALIPPQAHVDLHSTLGVDGEALVRIDSDTEKTRIGIDKLILVPNHRVPQDASIIQICQASHIVRAVKLGRVDLANLVFLENLGVLAQDLNSDLLTINGLNETFIITTSGLVRSPDRLFRVVGLRLELKFKLI